MGNVMIGGEETPLVTTNSYVFPLSILYLIEVLACAVQLSRIVYYKHKFKHYQSYFLMLCFWWCLLRFIYFLFVNIAGNIYGIALYVLPFNIQFATFSLLVFYYAEIVHKQDWRRLRRKQFLFAFVITNALFLIWILTYIGLMAHYIYLPPPSSPSPPPSNRSSSNISSSSLYVSDIPIDITSTWNSDSSFFNFLTSLSSSSSSSSS